MRSDTSLIPTISRVFDDGTMLELVFDPATTATAFAVAAPGEAPRIISEYTADTGDRLIPYSATNNLIATGCVLLPSAIGDTWEKVDLVRQVQAFLHRYVDLSPLFEEIAAHYVLLSWVYDAFNDLPYLRLRGDWGSGKTRGLLTIGSLMYKPFFASGASTPSPIFHIQDAFQGTLVLDEADFRFSDQTAELTKILNNGTTRGLPVLRTMANRHKELNPTAFRVYGPKLIAMRESFSDQALESRFLTEETGGRSLRSDIPIHLPDSFGSEALALRNQLLAWRFQARGAVRPDASRLPDGAAPRTKQSTLALLSLIDDEGLRALLVEHLAGLDASLAAERAESLDAVMVSALVAAFEASPAPHAPLRDVASFFNRRAREELGQPMANKWVGNFIRRRLRLSTKKTGGIFVVPPTDRTRVFHLAKQFGLETS